MSEVAYRKTLDEAHAFMNQKNYAGASAKFVLAATQDVQANWKANSLHNAALMLWHGGRSTLDVDKLLDQALGILDKEDPLNETNILIKTRIDRKKGSM